MKNKRYTVTHVNIPPMFDDEVCTSEVATDKHTYRAKTEETCLTFQVLICFSDIVG